MRVSFAEDETITSKAAYSVQQVERSPSSRNSSRISYKGGRLNVQHPLKRTLISRKWCAPRFIHVGVVDVFHMTIGE